MFQNVSDEFWQYGVIVLVVVALLGLKALTMKTNYNRQLDQFVHPSIFMQEIKKKVKSAEEAEKILSINLNNQLDHNRLRNVSILVTYLNDAAYHSKCAKILKKKMESIQNLTTASRQYVNYIKEATKDWD